jgi:hypothetical protein
MAFDRDRLGLRLIQIAGPYPGIPYDQGRFQFRHFNQPGPDRGGSRGQRQQG